MKKKNILFISVSLVLIVLLGIGVSYSMWNITTSQDTENTIYTKCFDVSITSQKNSIALENAYPITDEQGKKLTAFSFTITNTCDIFASYTVNLESLKGTTLNSNFLKVMLNNEELKLLSSYETTDIVNTGSIESHIMAKGSLGSGDSEDYTLRLWIDYDTTLEDLDNEIKTFKSKIVVKAQLSTWNPIKEGYTTLHDAILANEYQTTPAIAKTKIANKQEVDLSQTAPVIKWVEKTGSTVSKDYTKPAESVINTYNKDTGTEDKTTQASNLTLNDTKLRLFKTKKFDSSTARYSLVDPVYVDPTTLDFSGNQKYYFQTESIAYNKTTDKLYTSTGVGDITIYQVTGATKTNGTTTWHDVAYDSVTYKLTMVTLTETELETDKSDKGLYQGTDDYGTTYYYRGNVKNNIVQFAGFYWQIVRINGDGSIRLIYDGTEKNATGGEQTIGNSQFNINYNDPAYVGYMYGNQDGTMFDEVHTNATSSTIKTTIDNWYKTNIADKGYDQYVSTAVGFCGDRSLYSSSSGDGVQTDKDTTFGAYARYLASAAQFICPEPARDLYTTVDSNVGNKALTYPVGLITYDEIVFAGIDQRHINKLSWAYSIQHYWTMSPSVFYATKSYAREWNLVKDGYLYIGSSVGGSNGVRPVINLKSDVKISGGTGTANEPFIIDTN